MLMSAFLRENKNEDRQLIAMNELQVLQKNIFIDKQSGKDFDRPQYKKLLKKLRKDDLLYIKEHRPSRTQL